MPSFFQKDYKSRLIFNILLATIGVAVFLSLSVWLSLDISRRAGIIQSKKNEVASRTEKLGSLAILKSDFESAKPYFSILENILPIKDQLISLPREFEDLAKTGKINFGAAFPEESAGSDIEPGFISFNFSIGGTYDRILSFIKSAESGRYILNFSSLDISEGGEGFRGSLSGKVFYQ